MNIQTLLEQAAAKAPMPSMETKVANPRLVAHVDGDYMAYFASGSDNCSAGDARRNVLSRLEKLRLSTGATKVVMHLTHGASTKGERFLAAVTQPYQGQRTSGKKPRNWQFLREYLEMYDGPAFTPKLWKNREADDGIAYVCESVAKTEDLLHVVYTADKDMRMFPGLHVDWKTWEQVSVPFGAYDVLSESGTQYGHKWFWMQCLMGDPADHIPGLPGVGPGTAEALLSETRSNAGAAPLVFGKYSEVIGEDWRDYFAEQAVLLWMRTDRHAEVLDVLKLGVFGDKLASAFHRLYERVAVQRQELEALHG